MKVFSNVFEKKNLVFAFFAGIALLVGFTAPYFLPSRFFNDVPRIIFDPYNTIGLFGSYSFAIFFYRYTGLGSLPIQVVGIIQITLTFFILYRIGVPKNFYKLTLKNVLFYITLLITAIFMCMPSKEFITFLGFAYIMWLLIKNPYSYRKNVMLSLLTIASLGVFFRNYFLLVLALGVSMYVINMSLNLKKQAVFNIFLSLILMLAASLAHHIIKGEYISAETRESLNEWRKFSHEADSRIVSPFSVDTWYGEGLSIVYAYISLNIPVNEFKHYGKPQVIAFVIWQLLMFTVLVWCFDRCLFRKAESKYELWAFCILFGYFAVQSSFEPDLGSAIRHKIGLLPIFYICLYHKSLLPKNA